MQVNEYSIALGRNPLKSGQCFLQPPAMSLLAIFLVRIYVAIPSNRVNVSYYQNGNIINYMIKFFVAIPSNRVNISYSAFPS